MNNCVFCKIRNREIPSDMKYIDNDFMIIKDINPKAKIHLVAVPKKHLPLISMMDSDDAEVLGRIMGKISQLQNELGLEDGYRLIINQGADAGQTVDHVHIHILGGEKLSEF